MSIGKGLMALTLGALLAGSLAPAAAQDAVTVQVVARGLNNPRGLDIGPGGNVFVAETGRAGKNCVGPGFPWRCYGFTGSITKITAKGKRRVRLGLLSLGEKDGSFTIGANDVEVRSPRRIFTIVSSVGPKPARIGKRVAHQSGNLLKLPTKVGKKIVASIDRFEFRQNPDGGIVDSNPYSLEFVGSSRLAIDAGGNSLIRVGKKRSKRLVSVFAKRTFGGRAIDSVPTSVTRGPGGNYYVGELGGEGTPQGKARVWRVTPEGQKTVVEGGFDMIVGIDFGPDGDLYVVELLKNGWGQFATGDLTGALWKIAPNGDRTQLAAGRLRAPGGVAVAPNGAVYVSVNSVLPGKGRVLKITESA
jgi:hypothetical protein